MLRPRRPRLEGHRRRGLVLRGRCRGYLLAEWALSDLVGAVVALGTMVLLLQMLHTLQRTTQHLAVQHEQWLLSEALRHSLQSSGYRSSLGTAPGSAPGPLPSHDALRWDPSGGGTLSFQSDPWEPGGRTGRSFLRRQDGTLQWRPAGSQQFQAWTDPRLWAVTAWSVKELSFPSRCQTVAQLEWASVAGGTWVTEVRRRNRGPLPCETR